MLKYVILILIIVLLLVFVFVYLNNTVKLSGGDPQSLNDPNVSISGIVEAVRSSYPHLIPYQIYGRNFVDILEMYLFIRKYKVYHLIDINHPEDLDVLKAIEDKNPSTNTLENLFKYFIYQDGYEKIHCDIIGSLSEFIENLMNNITYGKIKAYAEEKSIGLKGRCFEYVSSIERLKSEANSKELERIAKNFSGDGNYLVFNNAMSKLFNMFDGHTTEETTEQFKNKEMEKINMIEFRQENEQFMTNTNTEFEALKSESSGEDLKLTTDFEKMLYIIGYYQNKFIKSGNLSDDYKNKILEYGSKLMMVKGVAYDKETIKILKFFMAKDQDYFTNLMDYMDSNDKRKYFPDEYALDYTRSITRLGYNCQIYKILNYSDKDSRLFEIINPNEVRYMGQYKNIKIFDAKQQSEYDELSSSYCGKLLWLYMLEIIKDTTTEYKNTISVPEPTKEQEVEPTKEPTKEQEVEPTKEQEVEPTKEPLESLINECTYIFPKYITNNASSNTNPFVMNKRMICSPNMNYSLCEPVLSNSDYETEKYFTTDVTLMTFYNTFEGENGKIQNTNPDFQIYKFVEPILLVNKGSIFIATINYMGNIVNDNPMKDYCKYIDASHMQYLILINRYMNLRMGIEENFVRSIEENDVLKTLRSVTYNTQFTRYHEFNIMVYRKFTNIKYGFSKMILDLIQYHMELNKDNLTVMQKRKYRVESQVPNEYYCVKFEEKFKLYHDNEDYRDPTGTYEAAEPENSEISILFPHLKYKLPIMKEVNEKDQLYYERLEILCIVAFRPDKKLYIRFEGQYEDQYMKPGDTLQQFINDNENLMKNFTDYIKNIFENELDKTIYELFSNYIDFESGNKEYSIYKNSYLYDKIYNVKS